jgi:uncharacterized protein
MTASALYEGTVRHRRLTPRPHAFTYRVFLCYLDLDELPSLFDGRWFWSARRPAPVWFRRADYLGDPSVPLDTAVRDLVEERTGRRPTGPIRLLTHLRTLGYVQNPVSFYYCFAADGETLETVVAEVTNTPWGERHAYVIARPVVGSVSRTIRFPKAFHVSPFLPMELAYEWRFTLPGERLTVAMADLSDGERVFEAALDLERRPITGRSLASALLRFPWMTARVVAAIYWQAFRLWWRGTPFYPHPDPRRPDGSAVVTG